MYKFGKSSKKRLATLHKDLQLVLNEVIKVYNISIICGFRNETAQEQAFKDKTSTKHWPDSNHNVFPSNAVDLAPWNNGIDWEDIYEFYYMAGIVMVTAERLGIKLEWSGRWKTFKEYGHFQIKKK